MRGEQRSSRGAPRRQSLLVHENQLVTDLAAEATGAHHRHPLNARSRITCSALRRPVPDRARKSVIEEQDVRLHRYGPGDCKTLLLSGRKRGGVSILSEAAAGQQDFNDARRLNPPSVQQMKHFSLVPRNAAETGAAYMRRTIDHSSFNHSFNQWVFKCLFYAEGCEQWSTHCQVASPFSLCSYAF